AGWLVAAPVPFLLMWAPAWGWMLGANVLLGASQGLIGSTTAIMRMDLAGPHHRGLAMGLDERAVVGAGALAVLGTRYSAVALSALATGYLTTRFGWHPAPLYLGVGFVTAGIVLSVWAVRETRHHAAREAALAGATAAPSA